MKVSYNYGNNGRKVIVSLMAILFVAITVLLIITNKGGNVWYYKDISISGVLTAVQFGIALIMVAIEYELGGALAAILVFVSFWSNLIRMVATGNMSALPGLCYYVVSLTAICFIRGRISRERANSLTDDLTGLSNRKHILQYINHLILTNTPFYIIFLDLNNFKIVNDTQGHEKGDSLIKEISDKWSGVSTKNAALGRFGGDEFIVVIKKNKCKDVEMLATEYVNTVKDIVEEYGSKYSYLSVSAGIVDYPTSSKQASELLRKADIAVNKAQKEGRYLVAMYYDDFEDEITRERHIEARIKHALENEQFCMYYQPQFDADTKKLRGFEALIRMRDDYQSPLSPGEFIPVAEKSDLIIDIGEYVLRTVMGEFAPILALNKDITVSVNISAKQILSKNFVHVVRKILDDTRFNPRMLEIEITEYCLMDVSGEAIRVINELKALGIQIAMDDFGTGYSSISYLTKLPIDLLKIDKSIVDAMGKGDIIGAICSMGHAISCEIIAEGVEEDTQLSVLREKGCDYIQGFVWGKPMPFKDALKLL